MPPPPAQAAAAQGTPDLSFRVIDLFNEFPCENGITSVTSSRALGINSKNQVVGWYTNGPLPTRNAFIWLPEPDYGLPRGMHDLNTVSGYPQAYSQANAISDDGVIAGHYNAGSGTEPFVWDLRAGSGNYTCVHITEQGGQSQSPCPSSNVIELSHLICSLTNCAAQDVSNGDALNPPVVVGFTSRSNDDDCFRSKAFALTLDSPSPTFNELHTFHNDQEANVRAYAVDPMPSATPRIGGRYTQAIGHGTPGECGEGAACVTSDLVCVGDIDDCYLFAAEWHGASRTQMPYIDDADEHVSYDVNNQGNHVGQGKEQCDAGVGFHGYQRATFWESSASSPDVLDNTPNTQDPARANAVTNDLGGGELVVVGHNEQEQLAILWHREDPLDDWDGDDLNDLISSGCANTWELIEATDINDDLAVSGWGLDSNVGEERAFLLVPDETPDSCPADLNCDGCVDGADHGILLSQWGPCDDCDDCPADLNGDCEVDGADLGILLAAWGSCGDCPAEGCPDPEDAPDEETIESAEQGDYLPLFMWLMAEGYDDVAFDLANTTGFME